jgi:glycosyltransferase involved in cell wall biosynthesis
MNILFLSRWYPFPPDNGSKARVFNLIRQLSQRHTVDLVSFTSETLSRERLEEMNRTCRSVATVPLRTFAPLSARSLLAFVSPRPRYFVDTYSREMEELSARAAAQHRPDLVLASEVDMAEYALRLAYRPRLLEDVELASLREAYTSAGSVAARLRHGLTWFKTKNYVRRLVASFDGCTVVSEIERSIVEGLAPKATRLEVVPNGVNLSDGSVDFGEPRENTLIYAGSLTYSANFDAVDFFLREIYPLVRRRRPGVKLLVTGAADADLRRRLPQSEGVAFSGYLDDVRPAVSQSWLSVVPLRQGGGTRAKILESLMLGTPVVSTSKGAEGLELQPERDILIADSPAEFAASVVRLLEDPSLRECLRTNGRRALEGRYDWPSVGTILLDFVERLAER